MIRRTFDKLFGQDHLVNTTALYDGMCEQVTSERHLAEHALHGHMATVQGSDALFTEQGRDELWGEEAEQGLERSNQLT